MPDLVNNLKLSIEWEDPGSARGEELRATWCRLSIHVGQIPVTRVYDERAQTVRDAVYCPVYPLAEWFACHWWTLLNESERPSSSAQGHNLRFAREGFALPDLELFSEDSLIRAVWKPCRPEAAPVQFLNEGFALLDRKAVASEIQSFIGKVVARLESQNVTGTVLAEEWRAIGETSAAEKDFCETAGALGLDPYDLEDKQADEIVTVAEGLPQEMKREFFLAADAPRLFQQARWVAQCLDQLAEDQTKTRWAGKKGRYRDLATAPTPWQGGYDLARTIRKEFGFGNPTKPLSLDKLCGLKRGSLPLIQVGSKQQFDGVARLAASFGPQVATAKSRESSQGYLLARALCEFLCSGTEESAILTRVSSDRQKRNRAFAAELLAPAEGLRQLLSGGRIARVEIAEVAAHLGVSEWLIEHQVENHQIAAIEATVPLPAGKPQSPPHD